MQKKVSQLSLGARSISATSIGSKNGDDDPDFGKKRTFGSAMFKKVAIKSLRMKRQNKLILDEAMTLVKSVFVRLSAGCVVLCCVL